MYWVKLSVRGGGERGLDVAGLLVVDGGDVVRDVVVHGAVASRAASTPTTTGSSS
jgi:hypothetical protein